MCKEFVIWVYDVRYDVTINRVKVYNTDIKRFIYNYFVTTESNNKFNQWCFTREIFEEHENEFIQIVLENIKIYLRRLKENE